MGDSCVGSLVGALYAAGNFPPRVVRPPFFSAVRFSCRRFREATRTDTKRDTKPRLKKPPQLRIDQNHLLTERRKTTKTTATAGRRNKHQSRTTQATTNDTAAAAGRRSRQRKRGDSGAEGNGVRRGGPVVGPLIYSRLDALTHSSTH